MAGTFLFEEILKSYAFLKADFFSRKCISLITKIYQLFVV